MDEVGKPGSLYLSLKRVAELAAGGSSWEGRTKGLRSSD